MSRRRLQERRFEVLCGTVEAIEGAKPREEKRAMASQANERESPCALPIIPANTCNDVNASEV